MNRKQRRAVAKQAIPSPKVQATDNALFSQAVGHHQAGRLAEAERIYQAILAENPDHAESLNLLGVVAAQTGRHALAVRYIGKAIALKNQDPSFYNNLGETLRLQGKLPEAAQAFRAALALEPAYAEAHNNLGAVRHAMGLLEEAIRHYRRALDLKTHYPEALNNIGAAHQESGRCDLALMRYRQAIALRPDYADAHSNLGTALLSRGQFTEGWREYEWRRQLAEIRGATPWADRPQWQGEDISGRTILLYGEQGFGDILQFARFATPIAALGATVILETHPALAQLLSSVAGVSSVVAKGETPPPFDVCLSLMSAPFVLGTTLETIPAAIPYVEPDAANVGKWADRVKALPGLKIGLAWAGAPRLNDPRNHAVSRRRNMALVDMAPLLAIPGCSFVSLQMGPPAAQGREIAPDRRPHDWTAEISDFADTAGLVAHLDLVITVDTSVAHLAGAMGKPVWIASRFDGCWRWLADREDSPWYPTARLFRQPEPGNWRAVIARAAAALERLAGAPDRIGDEDASPSPRPSPTRGEGEEVAATHYNQGAALQAAGRPFEAEAAYRAAIAADPRHAKAHNNLGNVLAGQGRREEALAAFRSAIASQPDYAEAHYNRGILFHKDGRLPEASQAYRDALRLRPDFAEALTNLGAALQEMGRFEEAAAVQRACLARQPDDPRTHLNLGVVLKSQGRIDAAIDACRRAIACQPIYPLAHVNLAHLLLLRGDFAEGWREYEWRWRGGVEGLLPRFPDERRWSGQNVQGRTILLHAEQGLGDTLQFIRYAACFAERGAIVHVECHAPLARLLAAQPGIAQVVAMGEPLPAFDDHLPLMSTPDAWGTRLDTIPADIPYIAADAGLAAAWNKRLARLSGLKVGLVWAGDPRRHDYRLSAADSRRSIALSHLAPLLSVPSVSFVSLQKGAAATQREELPAELRPLDMMDDVEDFADTAALVANLDLVITVDTSVAHLAGAMGKPVWILSRFDGCWRWLADREDSPWYPTARLFRQTTPGDWDTVVARVATELGKMATLSPHRHPRESGDPGVTKKLAESPWIPASAGMTGKNTSASDIAPLFTQARNHHLAGRLSAAEAGYRHILASHPQHADSLHLLGVAAFQTGRNAQALDLIGRSIALVPANAEAHNNLGNVWRATGQTEAAIAAFQRALRLKKIYPEAQLNLGKTWLSLRQPDKAAEAFRAATAMAPLNAHAHYCLGVVLQEQARLAEAVTAYRAAIALQPTDSQALNNLGNVLKDLGRFEQAIDSFRTALRIRPDYWEARYNLGLAFQRQGRPAEAMIAYEAALAVHPDSPEIQTNVGTALRDLGRLSEAEAAQRASLLADPDYPRAHNNLGIVLKEQDRLDEASAAFRQAIARRPDYAEAHNNLGVTLMEMDRPEEAIAAYRTALACKPQDPEPQNNLGVTLHQMGRLEEAILAYQRAVRLKPDYAEARTNLGMAHLALGDDSAGWQGYEWRWKGGLTNLAARDFAQPQWRGEDLTGRTILLHGEQGLGDVLQFVRYVPFVAARGGQVIVEAYAPLVRLLRTLAGSARIVAAGEPLPPFDCHLPLMSLPHVMGVAIATSLAVVPYLHAAPADADLWHGRLTGRTKPTVGLVWAGNPRLHDPGARAIDRRRSIPLARMAPLLATPGVDFVSLQTGIAAAQIADLPPELRPEDLTAGIADFADTAGLMANLDLIISVDTAAVHLAGALGKPVWILSRFDGCWRWGVKRDDSPWYPTARLFRQNAPGDWESVIARVATGLRQWIDKTEYI